MSQRPLGETSGSTLATRIFAEIQARIISGAFRPGQKLRVRELAETFGTGLSPVREALNRLSRDGFVSQMDQRGFFVTPVSEQDLDELTRARCWLNERALRESIARGDETWEENLVIAFHRMSRTPRWVAETDEVNPEWEQAHRLFHRRLIEACGSRWIVEFCEQMFDAADRYRRMARLAKDAKMRDEHREIMDAALARDADLAASLLNQHFQRTAELCRGELHRFAPATPAASQRSSRRSARPDAPPH